MNLLDILRKDLNKSLKGFSEDTSTQWNEVKKTAHDMKQKYRINKENTK